MNFASKLIHNGYEKDPVTGALSYPIYHASTYHQSDVDEGQEFDYSRSGNPTRKALEEVVALLEGGHRAFAFSSGMAASSSALSIFSSGDHILVCQDVYGGTYRISTTFFNRFGVEAEFVDATDIEDIRSKLRPNTKALYLETPSNPLLKITDLRKAIALAKENGLLVLIDNTFMTPYLQRPIELGADIVIHSATKFIGGHSDVLAGLVITAAPELSKRVYAVQNGFGAVLGPQDSWLLLRGLKTLKVRMDYQQKNAGKIAQWLSGHPKVEKVYYPGLKDHPGSQIHLSQAGGPGAVLSFETKELESAKKFMKNLKLAAVAVSLGAVETIASYPVRMSHAAIPRAEREKLGVSDRLIRISAGLEDSEDLINDFKQALD